MLAFAVGITLTMDDPSLVSKFVGYVSWGGAMIAGLALLRTFRSPPRTVSIEDTERELEQAGLLEVLEFRANRAIMVEEFEDEGLHFLMDLGGGRTLCLSGQYLYDYEPMTEFEDGVSRPRAFPNTHFLMKRHKVDSYTLSLEMLGDSFEPEDVFQHFKEDDFKFDRVMEDGQIISHLTFDEIIKNHGRVSLGERAGRWGEARIPNDKT